MLKWIKFFLRKGHECLLVHGDYSRTLTIDDSFIIKKHEISGFKFSNRKIAFILNLFLIPFIKIKIKNIIKKERIDLVHAFQIHPYAFWAALEKKTPLITTPMGSDVLVTAKKSFFYKSLLLYVLKKTDELNCDSIVLRDQIIKYGYLNQIDLIQNGVDTDFFVKVSKKAKELLKLKKGYKKNDILISYSRGLNQIYNLDILFSGFKLIKEKYNNCYLLLASYNKINDRIKCLIHSLNIENDVKLLGYLNLSELRELYQISDLYFSIPSSDSSPASVYEAMSCGVPTILSKLDWTDYKMKHMVNTYLIDKISPEAIFLSFLELMNNRELKENIISNARILVETYFNYTINMTAMEKIMNDLKQGKENKAWN